MSERPGSKYLNFVRSLVLGSAVAALATATATTAAGCGDSGGGTTIDASLNQGDSAGGGDGGIDGFLAIGPLPPPDLPRAA